MIVLMRRGAETYEIQSVFDRLVENGFQVKAVSDHGKSILSAIRPGQRQSPDEVDQVRSLPMVEDVIVLEQPYELVALESRGHRSVIEVDGVKVGGPEIVVMAGPCTVESEEQVMSTAAAVKAAGATVLRGGAYKPSTSPYSFQGLGEGGLQILRAAADAHALRVVTEVMDVRKVDLVCQFADILQIGTRNMQNYDLLREVGRVRKPVLLKRGMSARYDEWLLAAEYIALGGNEQIILCERGIRTFESETRNTLDLAAIPVLRSLTHLPIIVDPSQGTGNRDLVGPMSMAAIAAGADGLIIEVHPHPESALKDGPQSLTFPQFSQLMPNLARIAESVDRCLSQ